MQIQLLKNLVMELTQPGSEKIVDILFNKRDVNEFLIAKKMNLTVNQVRNILYKLSAEGLVSFIRKKDKKKGWFIYFWTLDNLKCLYKIEQDILKKIKELKEKLKLFEEGRFYKCTGCNIEVSEMIALEQDFSCNECAEIFELVDPTAHIRDLKGKITKKEKDLAEIRTEIELIRKTIEKKNVKEKKEIKKKSQKEIKKKSQKEIKKKSQKNSKK